MKVLLVLLVTSLSLTEGAPTSSSFTTSTATRRSSSSSSSCGRRNTPRYCAGTNYTASLLQTYLCGDSRLGPTRLPAASDDLAVAPLLAAALFGYDRFGGLCPGDFMKAWFGSVEDGGSGWWRYPPEDGFVIAAAGEPAGPDQSQGKGGAPIRGNVTLPEDTLLDRFGGEGGNFVSPAGAPYAQRALPPSNLVGFDEKYPYNYHVYSVAKPLVVLAGPIAPWFGQPGAGVQYMLYDKVSNLVAAGFLRREDPSVLLP